MTGRPRPARRSVVPIALAIVTLVGSVLIPARQSLRIMHLLRETGGVVEPARLLGARLEFGLTVESAALEAYAESGDSVELARYLTAAVEDDRRVVAIEDLARILDPDAADRAAAVRRSVWEWRESARRVVEAPGGGGRPLAEAGRTRRANYQAMLKDVGRLASHLAAEGSARREMIQQSERLGLLVNASLVLLAIAAVLAVADLSRRERRLAVTLRRRIDEERSLRHLARTLGAATAAEEVLRHVGQGAMATTNAPGVCVQCIGPGEGEVTTFVQVHGDVPPACVRGSRSRSLLESLVARGVAGAPTEIESIVELMAPCLAEHGAHRAGLAALLSAAGQPVGALVLLRDRRSSPFGEDARRQMQTLADLASAALLRIRVEAAERRALAEARDGRQELERVITSRSRLMRGFSHDVKNPLGAADGYAELLSDGIYGPLSGEQLASVGRIRRSINGALSLIDDLHELARAETGHLELARQRVDLCDLVLTSGEDYRAAAEAKQLSVAVEPECDALVVETDRARVRQIVGNLLSNAIKYTTRGRVALRVLREPAEPAGEGAGWAVVEVSDTGPGIPAAKRDVIFEEFVRLDSNGKPGTGLGLAISQRLAQALGGRITVRSELGTGSTFVLRLPLSPERGPVTHDGPTTVAQENGACAPLAWGHGGEPSTPRQSPGPRAG